MLLFRTQPVAAGLCFLIAVLFGFLGTGLATAQTEKQPEKTIIFEMRGKPWAKVFEWLSDQTGLPIISEYPPPTGSLDFISPRVGNEPRKYTIAEVIDIVNEALLAKKFILLRRDAALTLVPADEKVDQILIPQIALTDLPQRGKTEIVKIIVPLQALVAEDFAPEVKKMMGPFGEVVVLNKPNQLLLQDKVVSLRQILKTIHESEDLEKGQAETYSHKCQYIRASQAELVLRNFLGDPRQVIELTKPSIPGQGGPSRDSGPSTTRTKIRMHYITSDDRTNTVHVNGPPDKLAQAKAVLLKLDVPQPGQPPLLAGEPQLKTYPVAAGNADALAKILGEIYKSSPTLRISALSPSQIMVYAMPEDQMRIALDIQGGVRPTTSTTELIPLSVLDATKAVETLKGMFGDAKTGAPFVEADTLRNAIVVKGTVEQVKEVKAVIQAIGESPQAQGGSLRIITLEKGSAATLAEALEKLLPQMRNNPVKVILPGGEPRPAPAPTPQQPLPDGRGSSDKPISNNEPRPSGSGLSPVSFKAQDQLVDPAKKPVAGNKEQPITITAFGNKLIVVSEDQQALLLIGELVRLMTQTQAGEGDFEVIRLKNANAVEAARILDEAFNGPKSTNAGGGRGGPSGPGGSSSSGGGLPFPFSGGGLPGIVQGLTGAGGANPQRVERIRVVADPATNSLLVKATPLDMLTVRNLLGKAIDSAENDSKAVIRTWVLGPLKYANASEIAHLLTDVYRESMNNNPQGRSGVSTFGGFSPFGAFGGSQARPQTMNIDANGNPRGVTLSVGVDEKSNSLVLACPAAMYEDIKKLVEHMEKAAADSNQVVRVVPIKGIDPQLVQQALEAIQGQSRNSQRRDNGSGSTSPFGGSGRSPFGGSTPGGFTPGGFTPGGFSPGGGGGFRPGGTTRPSPQSRGPDFFAPSVTDDRLVLFDPNREAPQRESAPREEVVYDLVTGEKVNRITGDAAKAAAHEVSGLVPRNEAPSVAPASYQQPAAQPQPPQPMPLPMKQDSVTAPRLPVTAESLEELGVLVLRANNPADLEAALRIIEYLQTLGAGASIDIQLVPLKFADATSVANTLNQLFNRVIIGPNSTTAAPATGNQPRSTFQPQVGGQQQQGAAAAQPQVQAQGNLVLIALPRLNSILLATPKARTQDLLKEIVRLDQPVSPEGRAQGFALKRASAARVATLLQNFYADRFPAETRAQHQIRVTYDENTNTVFVQAAPADLAEIRDLIERIDNTVSNAVNDLKIIPLRNAIAEDLANLLLRSIAEGVGTTGTQAGGVFPQFGGGGGGLGQQGGLGQGNIGQQGLGGQGLGQTGGLQGNLSQSRAGQTKISSLRFLSTRKEGPKIVEAGVLEDLRINADPRTNSLVIAAPEKTMQLILALVRELDVVPSARAEINIFTLKRADATRVALLLQQLFLGTGGTGAGTGQVGQGGLGAQGGLQGGLPGLQNIGGLQGAAGQQRPLQLTLGGTTPDGVPLIDLRLTVDERTNSLIIAGSRNDLDVIEAIIGRLEDSNIQQRTNQSYRLTYAQAPDVANALNDFLTKSLTVLQKGNFLTSFQEIQREVIIVAEPISNTLLISATPQYFADIVRLIQQLDLMPPQVAIQVLVAEVDLIDSKEFGVELGLQSPVLFRRGIFPDPNFLGGGSVNFANVTDGTSLVPPGVTVNNTINPAALPGFNFNNVQQPLGNNPAVSPGVVGFQGLSNLGVGRVSPTNNIGGFVFSASSNSVNVLVRALQVQNRLDILSKPQIMTLDNQTAIINVGQEIPIVTSTSTTATGIVQSNIDRRNVGVILQVTPKISPDGRVLMRVIPEISSVVPTPVNLGNGQLGTALNVQHLETTVSAYDGETVVLGGLINKTRTLVENKVPCLGDLPGIGGLFRYRTANTSRVELIIVLTPHVVRNRAEGERILAEEAKRIPWLKCDVERIQGPHNLDVLLGGQSEREIIETPRELFPIIPPAEPLPEPRPLPPGAMETPESRTNVVRPTVRYGQSR